MSQCEVKKGFFTLRQCESPSKKKCSICQRLICSEHIKKNVAANTTCIECYAKSDDKDDDMFDGTYAYSYRKSYYEDNHYSPFYFGYMQDSYYDDYDVRAFNKSEAYIGEPGDDYSDGDDFDDGDVDFDDS